MKLLFSNSFTIVICTALFMVLQPMHISGAEPVRVIFDTDISSDVDDVGAVAVLHALSNQGKTEILGMMVSSADPWSAPCLDALNTWFGRPDIQIGVVSEGGVRHESRYTAEIASSYPSELNGEASITSAVTLYRQILSEQPDNSVTIITVGYLTNLADLLASQPDVISPLNGRDLVDKKVKQLVCMGGKYPSGREWNFYQDGTSVKTVVDRWPVPILFCGFESGVSVLTGSDLKSVTEENPVKTAYQLYNGLTNRPSWDQLTVLFAMLSTKPLADIPDWYQVQRGTNKIGEDGSNVWGEDLEGRHGYTVSKKTNKELAEIIESLMLQAIQKALQDQ